MSSTIAKVKLIAGPTRSGKTTRLLEKYRDSLRQIGGRNCLDEKRSEKVVFGGRALWIGPSQQAVAQVRDRLIESADEAFLDPQFLTFAGFAESIVASSSRQIRPISRLQKRRILQQIVEEALENGKLEHFSWVAKTPGFLTQVDELIAELKRQDVWPEDFVKLCRQQRDRDLAVIYGLYQQYLNSNDLYDAEGRFWEARRNLSESAANSPATGQAKFSSAKYSLIVVDGFRDFTSAQYDILEQLGKRADEIFLTLTLDRESSEAASSKLDGRTLLFEKTNSTAERLRQKFSELKIEPSGSTHFPDATLEHLERNLFRDPNDFDLPPPIITGIEILAANGVHGEIEEIARRIKSLLRSDRVRPHDVVVVFRSLGDVAGRISEVFADHGIPCSMAPWQSLASAPLSRAILSLLRLHAEDWPFRQLLAIVGNRLFRRFDALPDARIAMERCLRAAQLPAGKFALLDQIRRWAAASGETESKGSHDEEKTGSNEKLSALASQAKLAFTEFEKLASLLEELPRQATLADWVGYLERLVDGLEAFPQAGDRDQFVSSWDILRRGLGEIEKVEGWSTSDSSALSIDDLVQLLETVGSELQLPTRQDAIGRVRIFNAEAARYVSAKQVFLAGLEEQSFSASESVDAWFHAREYQPSPAGDEMLLFYELATRATEKLTLSYPALDAKGQSLSPSPLLTELEQCFGKTQLPQTSMPLGEVVAADSELLTPWSKSAYRRQAVAQALAGDRDWLAGMLVQPESTRLGHTLLGSMGCVASRSKRGLFGSFEGLLESDQAQAVLAKRFDSSHLWSPSQLESYATCPFRFFAEQILALEPPSELTLRSDARRRGSLLHQVLATLHQHLSNAKESGEDQPQLLARFHAVLDEAVAAVPLAGLQRWLREIERREIEAWAEQYVQQERDYREQWNDLDEPLCPTLFEVRFGPQVRSGNSASEDSASDDSGSGNRGSTSLPFELDLGSEQILLTGQIDRVDLGRVGQTTVFNIIDYKSGAEVKLQDEKIRSGRQLQLPLYAMAAEKLLLAGQEAVALSTGYWSIQGAGFSSGRRGGALVIRELKDQAIQSSAQWEQLQPVIMQRIGQLIGGIRGGQFPVINEDEFCTRSCSLSTICRVAHARSLEKEWAVNDETRMAEHE